METGDILDTVVKNILELLGRERGSKSRFCKSLNLSLSIIGDWKSGKTLSYEKHLPEIADYFGVTIDYLLGREPAQEHKENNLNDQEIELVQNYRRADPSIKKAINKLLDMKLGE